MTALVVVDLIYTAIVEHCRGTWPVEACGMVSRLHSPPPPGVASDPLFHPMRNVEQSTSHYSFDRDEQLALYRWMDEQGRDPYIIYHSHTRGDATPSPSDIRLAGEPSAYYLIVYLPDPGAAAQGRAWRIFAGQAREEPMQVVS